MFDDPYFCGKDVCAILEYKDVKQALQKNVKPKHKKDLKTIVDELDVWQTSNSITEIPSSKPSYHDGKAIYVSEPGFYLSRTSFADVINNLVKSKWVAVDFCGLTLVSRKDVSSFFFNVLN